MTANRLDSVVRNLPVAVEAAARSVRPSARAGFLSQLIAEREHVASQRRRRRAPIEMALQTYDAAGRISERRLPPGYRLALTV
jgi:hypothetical protein